MSKQGLTKYSALVYFDYHNDDASVYLATEADARIAELQAALNDRAQLVEALRRVPDMPEMHVTKRTDYTEGYVEGWNNCRAALAAAGVS